jgi:TrmH family RNA methyltransferase
MVIIESLYHSFVKHLVRVREDRGYRHENNSALITGYKLIEELVDRVAFKAVIIEQGRRVEPSHLRAPLYVVSHTILKKITGLENPEPIAAEVALPNPGRLHGKKWLVVIDGIADPGNMGNVLRSALALNWEGVFILSHSVDPFNEKALRAAKGATFRIPIQVGRWEELSSLIRENGLSVYLADAKGESIGKISIQPPLLLILGSEAQGASRESRECSTSISIPMGSEVESLNVAAAAAILMYEMRHR